MFELEVRVGVRCGGWRRGGGVGGWRDGEGEGVVLSRKDLGDENDSGGGSRRKTHPIGFKVSKI